MMIASSPAGSLPFSVVAIFATLALLLVATAVAAAGPGSDSPAVYPGYELVWNDEFDVDGLPNEEDWRFGREGFIRNNEVQWYQDDNAVIKDGVLVIEARKESRPNPNYIAGSESWKTNRPTIEYTSSLISTKGKREFLYGRFEIRAKVQADDSLWPAIWTLGSARSWPGCGEIDIMEYYRDHILANAAWLKDGPQPWSARWDASKTPVGELPRPENWDERFHVWRMDWDHDFIRIYIDDHLLNEVDLSKTFNERGDRANPFREPHYILLNLALGGDNADHPDDTDTEFPAHFIVDYVRVYQAVEGE
ncbi:MAG: glycoside hydrolase family 16 protein [Planctomycetota bacterium]